MLLKVDISTQVFGSDQSARGIGIVERSPEKKNVDRTGGTETG